MSGISTAPGPYCELHAHSAFSLLDGVPFPEELAERAAALRLPAMALTDHDAIYGAVPFFARARALGVKPILGAELTMDDNAHLTLLAETQAGYRSLCRLISAGRLAAPKGHSALPWGVLAEQAQGLVCLTGCKRGPLARRLLARQPLLAGQALDQLLEIFGPANLYVELQRHLCREDKRLTHQLAALAHSRQLKCVATGNAHYLSSDDADLHDVLLSIRERVPLPQARRRLTQPAPAGQMLRPNHQYYLRAPAAMQALYADLPEAVSNTLEVAERCTVALPAGLQVLPLYPTPEGQTAQDYLRRVCLEPLPKLYPRNKSQALALLEKELGLIEQLGLANYFLIVWDIVRFCRQRGILCHGRGSAANSLAAHLLGISAVDPIVQGLVVERFLSVEHGGTPDIDLDIDAARRETVIQYVYDHCGRDHAAMACTYVTFRSASAIRDAGFALGFKPETVERLASALESERRQHVPDNDGRLEPPDVPISEIAGKLQKLNAELSTPALPVATVDAEVLYLLQATATVDYLLAADGSVSFTEGLSAAWTITLEGVDVSTGVIQGNAPRFRATFKNSAGVVTDPSAVIFKIKDPTGVTTTFTYGVDSALVREGVGIYHVDQGMDAPEFWYWRWTGTITGGEAAVQGNLFIIAAHRRIAMLTRAKKSLMFFVGLLLAINPLLGAPASRQHQSVSVNANQAANVGAAEVRVASVADAGQVVSTPAPPGDVLQPVATQLPDTSPIQPAVGVPEVFLVDQTGGRVAPSDTLMTVDFPQGATSHYLQVRYQRLADPQQGSADTPGSPSYSFQLSATALDDPVIDASHFDLPLVFTIDLVKMGFTPGNLYGRSMAFKYYDDASAQWLDVPFTLNQDSTVATITARIDHFTVFEVLSQEDSGWAFNFDAPVVSLADGGATYNYPLSVPAGRNGLQPKLDLSYNSRNVDHRHTWEQSDWVGDGWSLGAGEIVQRLGTASTNSQGSCIGLYTLNLGGVGYDLQASTDTGHAKRYYTQVDSPLYLEFHDTGSVSNTTGTYWIVKGADGTTYRFGYTADAEQRIDCQTNTVSAESWHLDRATDVYGNQIKYTYTKEACTRAGASVDCGSYLSKIQ